MLLQTPIINQSAWHDIIICTVIKSWVNWAIWAWLLLTPDWLPVTGPVSGSTGLCSWREESGGQRRLVRTQHDGDRVIIFSNVTISELRQFVSSIYCEYPCCGWSSFDIQLKTEAESEDDDIECEYTVHWGAGHQGPAEGGTVPLGLVAAPRPLWQQWLRPRRVCRGRVSFARGGGRHPVLGQFYSRVGGWSLPRDGGRSGWCSWW